MGARSAAFQRETAALPESVTSTRCPSNAALRGAFSPFPVRVARTAPLEARTTDTEESPEFGTQMLVPSKAGWSGDAPTVTVRTTAPAGSSFRSVPALKSVTQTFDPSKTAPSSRLNPAVTVVTVHGIVAPGVMRETVPDWFAVQIRLPSNAIPSGMLPRLGASVVSAPAAWP